LPVVKTITQEIKTTPTSQNKLHNLATTIKRINHIEVRPGETFSFWRLVKAPTAKKGYVKSRSIINNTLQEDIGGGLCQLSGLIYFLALHAGLTVTERHAHSIDIYKEEERFTPLGSDATVAYGFKDLRFVNSLAQPVYLYFLLQQDALTGTISSAAPVLPYDIAFQYTHAENVVEVVTISSLNGQKCILAKNSYKKNDL